MLLAWGPLVLSLAVRVRFLLVLVIIASTLVRDDTLSLLARSETVIGIDSLFEYVGLCT